ncbi:MAG: ComEC family competence protein [Alphaproteobacteria bacterium]|nr:ComEC family competence protein [Alphaproteobacteria bacterium]
MESYDAGQTVEAATGARRVWHAFHRLIAANLSRERENWPLWLPVGLGLGIAVYFLLRTEPPLWLALLVAGVPFLALGFTWKYERLFLLVLALAIVGTGFSAAKIRTLLVAAPVLEKKTGVVAIEGRIEHFDTLPTAYRVTLGAPRIEGIAEAQTPGRVRVRLRRDQEREALNISDRVRVRGMLLPPGAPTAPGQFDFQRYAFFNGLGGVGFAIGPLEQIEPAKGTQNASAGRIERVRQQVFDRVMAALPGQPGAVAAALMTGKRGAIDESVLAAMRDSGLAHLLAISGLHIGLVAGILFFGVRALLALATPLAVRFHIKKWAAVAAIFGAFLYLLISGATIPTQRAFLMMGLVLLAVLLDRTGISMRLVAWAAFVVLLLQPESLLGASFQLSFAAVVALVAVYEGIRQPWIRGKAAGGLVRRAGLYVAGVGLTTLVAGLATAPFAIQHFNRFAEYGLAANLVAVPITALWVMPWAVVSFLLMPFGLEQAALVPMGWGVEGVIETAGTVAGWPGSVALVPSMPAAGFVAFVLGGLWLCLWRGRWRYGGAVGIVTGLLTIAFVRPPDVLVSGDAKLFAVRAEEGGYRLSSRRAGKLAGRDWLRLAGDARSLPWPKSGQSEDGRLTCDGQGCIYRLHGQVVALAFALDALVEDCGRVDVNVVVSREPARGRLCAGTPVVIDRFDLWRMGGHAIWLGEDGARVRNVRETRGERPWVLVPDGRDRKTD